MYGCNQPNHLSGGVCFHLIELNEFDGGFVQFESFARDWQGLCGKHPSRKALQAWRKPKTDQVIAGPASIVHHHLFVLPGNRHKIDISRVWAFLQWKCSSESSIEPKGLWPPCWHSNKRRNLFRPLTAASICELDGKQFF